MSMLWLAGETGAWRAALGEAARLLEPRQDHRQARRTGRDLARVDHAQHPRLQGLARRRRERRPSIGSVAPVRAWSSGREMFDRDAIDLLAGAPGSLVGMRTTQEGCGVFSSDSTSCLAQALARSRVIGRQCVALGGVLAGCAVWWLSPLEEPEPFVGLVLLVGGAVLLVDLGLSGFERARATAHVDELIVAGLHYRPSGRTRSSARSRIACVGWRAGDHAAAWRVVCGAGCDWRMGRCTPRGGTCEPRFCGRWPRTRGERCSTSTRSSARWPSCRARACRSAGVGAALECRLGAAVVLTDGGARGRRGAPAARSCGARGLIDRLDTPKRRRRRRPRRCHQRPSRRRLGHSRCEVRLVDIAWASLSEEE